MLVLSRKQSENIVFDLRDLNLDNIPKDQRLIKVTVVNIRSDKTRLGIEAPRSIPCNRSEVQAVIDGNRHD